MAVFSIVFFVNDTATTEIYPYGHTPALHDALPICPRRAGVAAAGVGATASAGGTWAATGGSPALNPTTCSPGWASSGRSSSIAGPTPRSEEHTSALQSLMRISYAVICLKKKKTQLNT